MGQDNALELYVTTIEDGLRRGVEHFRVPAEDLDVRVLEEKRSFLGWARGYRLRIAPRPPTMDGRYDLVLDGRCCLLTVTRPSGAGAPVKLTDVQAALEEWPLEGVDLRAVREAVESPEGKPVAVGYLRVPPRLPAGQGFFCHRHPGPHARLRVPGAAGGG
jgi:hypothetical protein